MAALALWFQDVPAAGFSAGSEKMIAWSLVIIAAALALQALLWIGVGLGALIALKKAQSTVDEVRRELKGTVGDVRGEIRTELTEIKGKLYPVIDSVTHISASAKNIIADAEPKIKAITGHIVDTTQVVRDSAQRFGQTASDANTKTQRQVARVDGMVTGALNTAQDIVHAVEHGIKVPAQKIAVAATEARVIAEGVLDRVKAMAANLPFMPSKGQKIPGSPAGYKPPVQRTATTPPGATGPVPLVK